MVRCERGKNISGVGEQAGLYNFDEVQINLKQKANINLLNSATVRSVATVPLSAFVVMHNISKVDYVAIDVEGFEAKVIKGMKLHEIENRRIFSAIQFELGGTWTDLRRPNDSWTLSEVAAHLPDNGYNLYLIGENLLFKVTKDFFPKILSTDAYVNGNALALHPDFASPVVNKLIESVNCDISSPHLYAEGASQPNWCSCSWCD